MTLILGLLQLSSPTLPLGAYSYSEGLENLVEMGAIADDETLFNWLVQELTIGAIRMEAAVMVRAFRGFKKRDFSGLSTWNKWLSAGKETSELRQQSWQMGNSLWGLLLELENVSEASNSDSPLKVALTTIGKPCNYAIAFGVGAANWNLDEKMALLGYLQSWTSHAIGAGVKLIPLGQTVGQQLLFKSNKTIAEVAEEILLLKDDDLVSCSWGLSLASMAHEVQYTRLFRS